MLSILIITYNQEHTLRKLFDSIIELDFPDVNIILADDFSNDNTIIVSQEYLSRLPNITVVRTPHNLGIYGNIKNGLNYVKTEYLSIIGGDDYYCNNFLKTFYDCHKNKGDKDVFIFNHYIETKSGFRYKWNNFSLKSKNILKAQVRHALSTRNSVFNSKVFKAIYQSDLSKSVGVRSTCDIIYDIELARLIKSWEFIDVYSSVYVIGDGITYSQDHSVSFRDSFISYDFLKKNSKKLELTYCDILFVKFMFYGLNFRYNPNLKNFFLTLYFYLINIANFYPTNNAIYNLKFLFSFKIKEKLRKYYYKFIDIFNN